MNPKYRRQSTVIHANLTPMIDVTFLLIIFFVLVAQIVEVEQVEMDLPVPADPVSELAMEDQRVVINVVPDEDGRVLEYRMGALCYAPGVAGLSQLTDNLVTLYQTNPDLQINLRADQSTQYQHVEPVLEAIRQAAYHVRDASLVARVNVAVRREN